LQFSSSHLMCDTKGLSMRKSRWFIPLSAVVFLGVLFSVSACQGQNQSQTAAKDAAPAAAQPQYQATSTIKDIMLSIVDPNADVVWLSVTTVQSSKGTVDTAPKNDEEWKKVRQGAIALTEASNLLMMPGRHVAAPGEKSETPGVELEPSEMEELINKDRASWVMRATKLHEAGLAAVQAVDAKDPQKVFEVGEQIEQACENCHRQYWYPNEQIPPVPASTQ
jgi:cytochrome c556